jgi:hypothetical protein
MMLCRSDDGHFAVESVLDKCCSSFEHSKPPSSPAISLCEVESSTHDDCGPCSDTPLLTNFFRIPTQERYSSVSPAQIATITPGRITFRTKTLFVGVDNLKELALIPIKTTTLLL